MIKYDELSDTFYVSFSPGERATGIELNENLLLRVNKAARRAVGLSIFNYSFLAQQGDLVQLCVIPVKGYLLGLDLAWGPGTLQNKGVWPAESTEIHREPRLKFSVNLREPLRSLR